MEICNNSYIQNKSNSLVAMTLLHIKIARDVRHNVDVMPLPYYQHKSIQLAACQLNLLNNQLHYNSVLNWGSSDIWHVETGINSRKLLMKDLAHSSKKEGHIKSINIYNGYKDDFIGRLNHFCLKPNKISFSSD